MKEADQRVMGSAAVSLYRFNGVLKRRLSAEHGANVVRVHDVKATKEALDMFYGIFPNESRWSCLL